MLTDDDDSVQKKEIELNIGTGEVQTSANFINLQDEVNFVQSPGAADIAQIKASLTPSRDDVRSKSQSGQSRLPYIYEASEQLQTLKQSSLKPQHSWRRKGS